MHPVVAALQIAAGPIADILKRRSERKQAKVEIQAKAAMVKVAGAHEQTLTDAEWEVVSLSQQGGTWKDEYATIIATTPYLAVFLGCVYYAFTKDYRMLEGAISGIRALEAVGVDVGFIMEAAILAALGLSIWRKV